MSSLLDRGASPGLSGCGAGPLGGQLAEPVEHRVDRAPELAAHDDQVLAAVSALRGV
jgi:hypothetical protein